MRLSFLLAPVAFAIAASVHAQTAGNAPSSSTPASVPKHTCTKPGEFPGSLASDNQRRAYQKEYIAYTDCLKKFVADQQKLAEPHVKAANDTVTEYNAAVKAFNDEAEKLKKQ